MGVTASPRPFKKTTLQIVRKMLYPEKPEVPVDYFRGSKISQTPNQTQPSLQFFSVLSAYHDMRSRHRGIKNHTGAASRGKTQIISVLFRRKAKNLKH